MPNYGLVVTPTYNPMSFEEYAKPFQLYSEAYNKMADAYDQLELEAGQWEKLRDNAQDQEQWNIANKYLTDLRDAAEDLATNGLNLNTRGKVSNLRGRYSKEILPITEAWNRRLEDIKSEDDLIAKDPSIVIAKSARERGLSDYSAGTPQRYFVSGNDVYAKTLSAFKAISSRDISFEELKRFGNTYWSLAKIQGEENPAGMLAGIQRMLNTEEGFEAIANATGDPEAFLQYATALENTLGSTNYDKLTSDGKSKILQSALLGANTGIVYDRNESLHPDIYAAEYAKRRASGQDVVAKFGALNPRRLYTPNEKAILATHSNLFDENGKLTEEGKKSILRSTFNPGPGTSVSAGIVVLQEGSPKLTDFGKIVYDEAVKKYPDLKVLKDSENAVITLMQKNPEEFYTIIEDAYSKLNSEDFSDLKSEREWVHNYTAEGTGQAETLKNQINEILKTNKIKLKEVEFDGSKYNEIGDGPDFISEDAKIINSTYSKYGATFSVKEGDEIKRYKLPSGLYTVSEQNRDRQLAAMENYANLYRKALESNNLNDARFYYDKYRNAAVQANYYHSQIGYSNKTKPQEYETNLQ